MLMYQMLRMRFNGRHLPPYLRRNLPLPRRILYLIPLTLKIHRCLHFLRMRALPLKKILRRLQTKTKRKEVVNSTNAYLGMRSWVILGNDGAIRASSCQCTYIVVCHKAATTTTTFYFYTTLEYRESKWVNTTYVRYVNVNVIYL